MSGMGISPCPLSLVGGCPNSWDADRHVGKQRMQRRLLKEYIFSKKNILAEKKCLPKVAKSLEDTLAGFHSSCGPIM